MINYPPAGAFAAPQHIDVIFLTNVEQSQRGFGKMAQYLKRAQKFYFKEIP